MQDFADRLVGGHAAGANQRGRRAEAVAEHAHSGAQPVHHHVDYRLLERSAQIGDVLVAQRRDLLRFEAQRRLQPGQRKIRIVTAGHRPRQGEPLGVAAGGLLLDQRAAGIAEAEELRGLVEGLADRVVDGAAEAQIIADATHGEDLGVAAGREKQAIGKRRGVGEPRRERVRLQVIHRDQRLVVGERDGLGRGQADNDAADQARPGRGGDAVERRERHLRLRHGLGDDGIERLDMGARRDLRHHAAEFGVLADLRQHDVGQNPPLAVLGPLDQGRGGLVAGRLDAEDDHLYIIRLPTSARGLAPEGLMAQSSTPVLRIGSRGSPLALVQAREVQSRLAAACGLDAERIEIKIIRTTGDVVQDRPLDELGGKGLFTKEIEEALLSGAIDLAVHSSKDMTTVLPAGLVLSAFLPREDARDAFISRKAKTLRDLPRGAVVGTASLRRQALVKRLRPDLAIVPLRGNVETRLRKIEAGEADATLLAVAGLKRLGLLGAAAALLDVDEFLPAVGQGAIGIETRADDTATRALVAKIDDADTATAVTAERAFLAVLAGSCRTPIGGHARINNDLVRFHGMIVKPDGSAAFEVLREGHRAQAAELGADAGRELKARGGADFFVRN